MLIYLSGRRMGWREQVVGSTCGHDFVDEWRQKFAMPTLPLEYQSQYVAWRLYGIGRCDLLFACEPGPTAYVEIGYARKAGKPIVIVGGAETARALAAVRFKTLEEGIQYLRAIG